jgi:hypothetical protein
MLFFPFNDVFNVECKDCLFNLFCSVLAGAFFIGSAESGFNAKSRVFGGCGALKVVQFARKLANACMPQALVLASGLAAAVTPSLYFLRRASLKRRFMKCQDLFHRLNFTGRELIKPLEFMAREINFSHPRDHESLVTNPSICSFPVPGVSNFPHL